jgi:hypothetical protein
VELLTKQNGNSKVKEMEEKVACPEKPEAGKKM